MYDALRPEMERFWVGDFYPFPWHGIIPPPPYTPWPVVPLIPFGHGLSTREFRVTHTVKTSTSLGD